MPHTRVVIEFLKFDGQLLRFSTMLFLMTPHANPVDPKLAEDFANRMRNPGSPVLPPLQALRNQVFERTASMLSAQGITDIALFGAGRHTRPIVRQPWIRYGIAVRVIFDDHPIQSAMGGVPIAKPCPDNLPDAVGAIVISSECYERQLDCRARQVFGGLDLPIVKLYTTDDAPYQADQTLERLAGLSNLTQDDARWLVENRGERHDALLPMLPPARTELHIRRYELAGDLIGCIGATAVADLACGTGYGSTILAHNHDITYVGVDIDLPTIQYAQRRYGSPTRQFHCASAIELPIDDNAVDLIASFETIEHIEQTSELCAQYARILKPGGLLVVSTPNKLGPTPHHVHDWDLEEFINALESRFEIIELIAQLPIDEVFDSHLPPGMWRIDRNRVNREAFDQSMPRPDFLLAIAKHPGASVPKLIEPDTNEITTLPSANDEVVIETKHGPICFYCPGGAAGWRAQTLLTKEPETLDWIDQFDQGDIYWDIGASTGPYVMYAAAADKAAQILAFEPSPWSWHVLAEQIRRSGQSDRIKAYPVAVNAGADSGTLHMRNPFAGGAGSSFGEPIDESGKIFTPTFAQGAIGISIDELVEVFNLPAPNRIKIDVDGIEEQILTGARRTLLDRKLKSVSVEIDSSRKDLVDLVAGRMQEAGLVYQQIRQPRAQQEDRPKTIENFVFTRNGAHP